MPTYSLGEIASLATTRIGRRADISLSDVSKNINMAYMEVWSHVPSQFLEKVASASVASGDSTVSLPTDFMEPITMRLQIYSSVTTPGPTFSYKTLDRIPLAQYDNSYSSNNGQPKGFAFFDGQILLQPSADSGYTVQFRYRSFATDLTATSDIPSLSTPWRHAVLLKTEVYLNEYIGNLQGATFSEQKFLRYIAQLKSDEARRASGEMRNHVSPVYTGVERSTWPRSSLYSY